MVQVALITLDSALTSSISLPLETLSAAEHFHRARRQPPVVGRCLLTGPEPGPAGMFGGLPLQVDRSLDSLKNIDMLFIPALWRNPRRVLKRQAGLVTQIRRLAEEGSTICAVGTGSYLLAATGLLDAQPGTTHWHYLDEFSRLFPRVRLQRQHLITQAGRLYCSGSINSLADLMVHLIAGLFDDATARHVEGQFSPEIRRPFDSYGFIKGRISPHADELVLEAQGWLLERLDGTPGMEDLAQHLGLSTRSLQRRFQQALGISPRQYLQDQRLQLARDLLRHSNLAIGEVAMRCGFHDASYFSAQFRRQLGQTPQSFRQQVRRKLFAQQATADDRTRTSRHP